MLKKVSKLFLIGVSCLFLITARFLFLNEFPVGILHDEVDVTLSSKYYFNNGTDISGIPFPKSLFVTKSWAGIAGLPSFLLTYVYGPFKLSPLVIRIPFVFVSILVSFFIYLIIFELTKNKRISLISLFVSFVNPWLYFYSRQPTEAPFALLFVLIGLYIFLKASGYKIFWSLIFFIASFYSYFGAKPVVPVLVIGLAFFANKLVKPRIKFLGLVFVISMFLLVFSYFALSKYYGGGTLGQRENQLTFLNFDKYSSIVNDVRRESIDFPLKSIFFNKYTIFLKITASKFLGPFSYEYLFLSGDSVVPFGDHGVLYLFDLPVMLFGVYFLLKSNNKNEKKLLLLLVLLFLAGSVGPAVSVVGNQFVFRAFLHIPAYILLISFALSKLNKPIFAISLFIYFLLFINFLVFFFFRYSISQQDNHFVAERVVASYLHRVDKAYVISLEPERLFYQAVFYNGSANRALFSDKCPVFEKGLTYIVESKLACGIEDNYVVIQNQKDSGVKYKIVNDKLCKDVNLTNYRRDHKVSDYNIEALDNVTFCNRWIQNGKTN